MSLAKKLNLKAGDTLAVVGKPAGADLGDVQTATAAKATGVLAYAASIADLDAKCAAAIAAARADRLAWIAYPKAGQLDTDLNRDILWKHLAPQGIQPVRQVALDDVWSAMRFRPGTR